MGEVGFLEVDYCIRRGLATMMAYCVLRLEYDDGGNALQSLNAVDAVRVCHSDELPTALK